MAEKATSVHQIFAAMPSRFLPDKANNIDVTIQFNLTGDDGGQWYIVVKDKTLQVNEGTAEHPTTTLTMTAQDYLNIINGDANSAMLFMQNKIKASGNLQYAMQMQQWFDNS